MPTGIKICKVCGKEYPYCKTVRNPNIFRYQDVACSPQCGSIYLKRVLLAREEDLKNSSETSDITIEKENEPAEVETTAKRKRVKKD